MSAATASSVIDVASLFPASLIGTALARLWVCDSLQNRLVPAKDDGGAVATCPITLAPIQHPVLLADGYVYEEAEICKWLQNHSQAPCTNDDLEHLCMLRLAPLCAAIEYFLLRSASANMESQDVSSLRRAIEEALQRDTPLSGRVNRLQNALSTAQEASEALSTGIADARILLVKLSAELSGARKTALAKLRKSVAAVRLQRSWRRKWGPTPTSQPNRAAHSQTAEEEQRQKKEQDMERELQRAIAKARKNEQMRRDANEALGSGGSLGSSPSKQSTAESLTHTLGQQNELGPYDSPQACPFSLKHRNVEALDVRDAEQSCASCGTSEVLLFACSRCQGEHYCSFGCQRRRWPMHKADCSSSRPPSGQVSAQSAQLKQVGQAIGHLPGSSSSRASRTASVPNSSGSTRDMTPQNPASGTSLAAVSSIGTLRGTPPQKEVETDESPFGSIFLAAPMQNTAQSDKTFDPSLTISAQCLGCGRQFGKRPPAGICDGCFTSHRGTLPVHHCVAYCHRCARVIDKVLDPMSGSSCGYCSQGVEATCALWRDLSQAQSPRRQKPPLSPTKDRQRAGSPAKPIDVEPPRVDCDLNTLYADLGEKCSDSPIEPLVAAALHAKVSAGIAIPNSPAEGLLAPALYEPEEPPASAIRARLHQLQQATRLVSTGNLISDVRQLADVFAIPFTTLDEVITSCEAALGVQLRKASSRSGLFPEGGQPLAPVQKGRMVDAYNSVRGGRK